MRPRPDRVLARAYTDRITVQAPTFTTDPIGGQIPGVPAVVLANEPALVEVLDVGRERLQVGQLRGSVAYLVSIHYRPALVTTTMQVLWSGRVLEIAAVDETPAELRLQCAEVMG
jgi:head-tail adaptor